ncbi:Oidioi.mRNA.OKI2018_I69.chr1.g1033.t1.cds [Oikopleura dioica]|uniref:Oidioi.mRNA.OKI2018_I69.chr1.g1033.t1.cds n=1 Tax=Oikopleura dioica TaxID=34765 RepID=A0ABN7SLP7_OIKDI|nr:Oidioi.mRNA.OKI2018_I69.chr1.g1033.t1.cds [Oikopleura dioica]
MKICTNLASLSFVFATPGTFPWIEDNGIDIQQGSRGIINLPIYEYEYEEDNSTSNERGAIQPDAKLNKMIANARDWIEAYAKDYRKKEKLIKVVDKIDVKFNNALKAKLCAYPENSRSLGEFERFEDDYYEFEIEEAMEEDSDPTGSALILARGKKKIDPIEKALKFKKGLDRWRNNYINQDCEKAVRLPTLSQKLYLTFETAIISQKSSKADYRLHKRQRKLSVIEPSF